MEGVFRIEKDISADEIIKKMNLGEIGDGTIFSISEFKRLNESKCIMDYDGSGSLIYDNKEVINSRIWCFNRSVLIGEDYILSYDSLITLFGDKISIIWFNK